MGGTFLVPVGQEGSHIIRKSGEHLHFSVEDTINSNELTPKLTILGNGRVGIGTTDPLSALQVVGGENNGANAALRINSGSQQLLVDGNEIDTNAAVGLYLNNNVPHRVVRANGGGNVGIGFGAPTTSRRAHDRGHRRDGAVRQSRRTHLRVKRDRKPRRSRGPYLRTRMRPVETASHPDG